MSERIKFRGIRRLIHYVHHKSEGFGYVLFPFLPKAPAWFPSTRKQRPCAYDGSGRPIQRGNRLRIVNTAHGRELHDCTKSGVF